MIRSDLNNRKGISQSDLQADSKTLEYEFVKLLGMSDRLYNRTNDDVARNAYVESFAIHCRNLILFIFGHQTEIKAGSITAPFGQMRPTDIFAYDFFTGWKAHCPVPSQVLVDAKQPADKQIAHITEARRNLNQPGSSYTSAWKFRAITDELVSIMNVFLQAAPADNFDPAALASMKTHVAGELRRRPQLVPAPATQQQAGTFVAPLLTAATQPAQTFATNAQTIVPNNAYSLPPTTPGAT